MRQLSFVVLLFACAFVRKSACGQVAPVEKNIRIQKLLMPDALRVVAATYQTVIGLESVDAPPFDHTITLALTQVSLSQTMDALMKADLRYFWRQESDGSVHVLSRNGKLTLPDILVESFNVENMKRKGISDMLDKQQEVDLWLREHGCSRVELTNPLRERDDATIGFTSSRKTLRENLDEVVRKTGTYFWSIVQLSGQECRVSIQIPPIYQASR